MAQLLTSLAEIATSYAVFEKDQVLTHEQLNSVARYLDDELRLSRIDLSGVGIVSGLHLGLSGNAVRVSAGLGVTTDGDLLRFEREVSFDRFKAYDEAAPEYAPFFTGETRATLYELVRDGQADERAFSLADFAARTGRPVAGMVGVLLVESYLADGDLCTSTDCDNLGKDAVRSVKLLLVDAAASGALVERVATPDAAARVLPHVVVERASIAGVALSSVLASRYRTACSATQAQLRAAFTALYPACQGFVADLFAADPAPGWNARLDALLRGFEDSGSASVQYYYDFLKDLSETYNAFRAQLFGERAWCCPSVGAFPKHLVLGTLSASATDVAPRTAFYPSPADAARCAGVDRARFLLRKLDAQIASFALPAGPVRITPSRFEDAPLEERAIPFYYTIDAATALHERWSYALTQRGMARHSYSYNADQYRAEGAAASPLTAQLGAFSFFRIEGHVGDRVEDALRAIEDQIKQRNLPFAVRAVQIPAALAVPPRRPPVLRPKPFTPLHWFHHAARETLAKQLSDAGRFSAVVQQQVQSAIDSDIVADTPQAGGLSLRETTAQRMGAVRTKSVAAVQKLSAPYAQYRQSPTWQQDLTDATESAVELLSGIGQLTTQSTASPFDAIVTPQLGWQLGVLDSLLDLQATRDEERERFSTFLRDNPSLEHFGGVTRGGTFVLAYDTETERVVADFMLPYMSAEAEPEPEPPIAVPQPIDPPIFERVPPIKLLPPVRLVSEDFTGLQLQLNTLLGRLDGQETYLQAFTNMLGTQGIGGAVNPAPVLPGLENKVLDSLVQEAEIKSQRVDYLRGQLVQGGLPEADREVLSTQLGRAEEELAGALEETTRFVAEQNVALTPGGDGASALGAVSRNLGKVRGGQVRQRLNANLGTIGDAAGPDVRGAINGIRTGL